MATEDGEKAVSASGSPRCPIRQNPNEHQLVLVQLDLQRAIWCEHSSHRVVVSLSLLSPCGGFSSLVCRSPYPTPCAAALHVSLFYPPSQKSVSPVIHCLHPGHSIIPCDLSSPSIPPSRLSRVPFAETSIVVDFPDGTKCATASPQQPRSAPIPPSP